MFVNHLWPQNGEDEVVDLGVAVAGWEESVGDHSNNNVAKPLLQNTLSPPEHLPPVCSNPLVRLINAGQFVLCTVGEIIFTSGSCYELLVNMGRL